MAFFDKLALGLSKALEFSTVEGVKTANTIKEELNPKEILRRAQEKVLVDQMMEKYLREKGLKPKRSSAIASATAKFERMKAELEEAEQTAERLAEEQSGS